MLLLIDAGNTLIKWALAETGRAGRWLDSGATSHEHLASLTASWRRLAVSRALVSNVAGVELRDRLDGLLRGMNPAPASIEWFASKPFLGGVTNGYVDFTQLGCDRFAAMIGARALFPGQPLIVATCGTATTIDALTADGTFIGGMILPGLRLMAAALARNTAQLPQVNVAADASPFANSTDGAIITGCITAQAGAIEHAVAEHARSAGEALCVLSGGAASYIAPHLSLPHHFVDNLVLTGLHAVATV